MKRALKRFGRVAVSVAVAGALVQYGDSPYYLVVAPLLNALSKYLREKHGIDLPV